MKLGSTHVLRAVIITIGLIVLGLCAVALPLAIKSELDGDFDYGWIFAGLYVPAIPFYIALYQAMKMLKLIDKNKAFSEASVQSLRNIKNCALAISGLFAAGMPYIFVVGDRDDAPGIVAFGLVVVIASFVIATAAALFQRLFQNAVEIKSENDLTV